MAELPELIGKYKISQLIAQGGMGAVYKAVHPTLKRNVILKKLTIRGNPQFIERFKREAKIMMDFKHDNIVTVYDHFKEGSSYFIVLEYVDGFSLEELIRRERAISSELAMFIFREVCKALKYAHDNGVIHRDIKPANILISKKGEVKLVDFGIAGYEAEAEGGDENLTTQGMTLGTLSYMPPEQFENTKNVDKGADIYAMGIMLYEMVTGKKPYPGNFSPDTLLLIKRGKYRHVRKMNPKVDRTIATLTGKMIRPKKEQRYRDLGQVLRILDKRLRRADVPELEKRLIAAMVGVGYAPPKRRGRKLVRRIFGLGLPGLVLVGVAVAWLYYSGTWYEWFFSRDYGSLTVDLNLPKGLDPSQSGIKAILERESGDAPKTNTINMPSAWQQITGLVGITRSQTVSSGKLYLKPGYYTLHLNVAQNYISESFYLAPFAIQKSDGRPQGMVLSYPFVPATARPLSLHIKVLDGRMRQDITGSAWVSLRGKHGEWLSPDNFPKDELVSGRDYQCKIVAYGFHTKEFELKVDAEQTEARVQVALVPLEGKLNFSSSVDGLDLNINGRDQVLGGGLNPSIQNLNAVKGKPLVLTLPPGPVRIEAKAGGRKGSLELEVVADGNQQIRVSAGSGSNDLVIQEQ